MGHRLSKIYTRTGDAGSTGLSDGQRIDKDDPRIEAIGDVDELNSALGVLLTHPLPETSRSYLTRIQHDLFNIGGELSIPGHSLVHDADVERLERAIDHLNADLPHLKEFILPGGSPAAASCHMARAICRRAERRVVNLGRKTPIKHASQRYLNRLSDLLFVVARVLARSDGGKEVAWQRNWN